MYQPNTQTSNSPSRDTSHPPPQANELEMPPETELMDIDIQEDIPDLIHIPEEILSDFDVWAHSVLEYQW